jgi:exopolysaccharide biosynthesis WecB/TagA/CpsF family protein
LTHLLALALASAGALVAVGCLYLLVLSLAAFVPSVRPLHSNPRRRLAVLVPAHDEAVLIGRCVASLFAQSYPAPRLRVVVIADNCQDETAAIARAAGAEVMERTDPGRRGKGYALRWAMDRLLAEPQPPDALVVVDADSVADPDLLRGLEAELERGAEVAQAEYLVLAETGSRRERLLAAAFVLFHRVRPAGRAVLRLPAALVGNGMIFSRELLAAHPWDALTAVEDLEYTIRLRLGGVKPAFAASARVYGPAPGSATAAAGQRARWEGGRLHIARTWLWRIAVAALVRPDPSLLDLALDLAVPPLTVLLLVASAGVAGSVLLVSTGTVSTWVAVPWLVGLAALPLYVVLGLRAGGAELSVRELLAGAGGFVVGKLGVYARLLRGHDAQRWNRTDRESDTAGSAGSRVDILGMPIDAVDMAQAVERVNAAIGGESLFQVCTVNLDFLMNGHSDSELAGIFGRSSLNLADGAPVVWLGRLLGRRLPGRVAGADLVPRLAESCASRGASLFLLGGEHGVAAAAAAELVARYPRLRIAGTHEPARAAVEEMANSDLVDRVNRSGADVVLVAFGHPKQERWIELSRERLEASVAIGVGCCFDLLAGRQQRAPRWMHPLGLEWAFRLLQEPGRLFDRYLVNAQWLLLTALPQVIAQRVRAA